MNNEQEIFKCIGKQTYKEVIEEIDKISIEESNKVYYLYLKGYCFYRLGNYLRTISLCKEALELGIEDEECYLLIGQSYEAMNWFHEAETNFLMGLTINPNNSEIKAAYAYLLLKNGYVCDAYNFMIEAITSNPENPMVNHYIVYFYLDKESLNFEKYGLINDFVENSENQILRYIKAGKLDMKKQRYKAAMDNLEKAYLLNFENEALGDLLDELRLKIKTAYKPSLIIDVIGGWNAWGKVFGMLAFVTLFMKVMQNNSLLDSIVSIIFSLWILMGVYKFALDTLYWNYFDWE